MQIHGVGSGHSSDMHQVTECMHNHSVSEKSGNMGAAASTHSTIQSELNSVRQQEGQFSLVSWLKSTLTNSRKLLQRIWGDSTGVSAKVENTGENVSKSNEQAMAATGLKQHAIQNNPYFSAIEDTGHTGQSLREKVRIRFYSIAGQLTRQFSGKNSFQTKQEKPKEDMRRHSRYREDDLEIECILTDDSYLLDSYDRKGEYSKLSTKK